MSLSRYSKIAAITTQNKLWDFREGHLLRGEDACRQLHAKTSVFPNATEELFSEFEVWTVWILFLLVCSLPKNFRNICTNSN